MDLFKKCDRCGYKLLRYPLGDGAESYIADVITITGRSTDHREQEADYFAASLLMPADEVETFHG